MPNFDGKGPLKRGHVIGRGLGFCRQNPPDANKCSLIKGSEVENDREEPK